MTKKHRQATWEELIAEVEKLPQDQMIKFAMHVQAIVRSPFSVYFINTRNYFPDNYPAKFDDQLARYLIETWSQPGDIVLDPMAGSGTIPLMALTLKRSAIYQDINDNAMQLFLSKVPHAVGNFDLGDSVYWASCNDSVKEIKNGGRLADLILTSPPFGLSIDAKHDRYSDNPDDLGNAASYELWRVKMEGILANCFKALKPGKLAIFETRLRSKDGHSFPLNMWIQELATDIGFEFFSEMITVTDYFKMVTYGKAEQVRPIPKHGYLTIMRKPLSSVNEKLL